MGFKLHVTKPALQGTLRGNTVDCLPARFDVACQSVANDLRPILHRILAGNDLLLILHRIVTTNSSPKRHSK